MQPNLALANGATDANLFQHGVYLEKFSADKGLKLSPLIRVPTAGLGFYSNKIKSLDELKKGDVITLANDPTNRCASRRARYSASSARAAPAKARCCAPSTCSSGLTAAAFCSTAAISPA